VTEAPPALDAGLVQAIVGNAHGDLAEVQRLLGEEPALVNAAWDWGGGDWETPLGAASHMKNREIALYLLDHGARIDVFAAAMLGHVDVVRAMLAERPELREAKGPHGIPLAAHASDEVLELLQ
jgi:hypothetical protein